MLDLNSLLATLTAATAVLTSLTLVLSRIIPDEYDDGAPVSRQTEFAETP
jgi:hypothetical protein